MINTVEQWAEFVALINSASNHTDVSQPGATAAAAGPRGFSASDHCVRVGARKVPITVGGHCLERSIKSKPEWNPKLY